MCRIICTSLSKHVGVSSLFFSLSVNHGHVRIGLVLSILLVKRVLHAHADIVALAVVRPLLYRTGVSRAFIRLIKVETKTAEVIVQMEVELFIEFIFSYRSALDRWYDVRWKYIVVWLVGWSTSVVHRERENFEQQQEMVKLRWISYARCLLIYYVTLLSIVLSTVRFRRC